MKEIIFIMWLDFLLSLGFFFQKPPELPSHQHNAVEKISMPTIYLGGDIMLSRSVGAMTKKYGTKHIIDGYNPFHDAEKNSIIFLNLESPFSENDRDTHERTFLFASNPRNVEVLSWLTANKVGIISLANNHIANAGME